MTSFIHFKLVRWLICFKMSNTVFITISAISGGRLFVSIFVARINQKMDDFGAMFRLIPSLLNSEHRVCKLKRIVLGRWLIIFWFAISKYVEWALTGAWAAIRMNMVPIFDVPGYCFCELIIKVMMIVMMTVMMTVIVRTKQDIPISR